MGDTNNDPTPKRKALAARLDTETGETLNMLESLADGEWDDDGLGSVLSVAYGEILRLAALRLDSAGA